MENKEMKQVGAQNVIEEGARVADERLGQVAGGGDKYATRTVGKYFFTGHIGKYKGIVGHKYYVVYDNCKEWYYGTMTKTWEKPEWGGLFGTTRTHRFTLILNNGYDCSAFNCEREFDGDCVTLYTDMVIQ